jgi:uncharacterized repeat protein (TIGR01451 family)
LAQTNQPPVLTHPASITVNEDSLFTFSGGNLLSIADPDVGSSNMTVTLSVTGSGILRLATTNGLTFLSGANASSSLQVRGGRTNLNTALSGMTYSNAPHANGAFSMSFNVSDLGHNGSGGVLTSNVTMGITVNAVNDRPVITLPGTTSVAEDGQIVLGIAVSDPDQPETPGYTFRFSMAATNGLFTLGSTNGLTFTAGNPIVTTGGVFAITNATFEGAFAAMNTALAGVVYLPRVNVNGGDNLIFSASDLGQTGSGGTLVTNINRAITITAVNDRPQVNLPPILIVDENTVGNFNLSGLVSDVDVNESPTGQVRVALSVTNGVLDLALTNGLNITGGALGTTGITFQAALTNVDNAVATLTYTPTPFFFGFDTLRVTVSDLGNTGSGGAFTSNDFVVIQVNEINEAPVLDPAASPVLDPIDEDDIGNNGNTVAQILASAGAPITDTDPGAVQGIAVIDADEAGGTWEFSINGGGTYNPFGPVFNNQALLLNPAARIRFVPDADYFGTNTFTFRAWDQTSGANGNTGIDTGINGGTTAFSTSSVAATITVLPVNDAPVVDNAAPFLFPDQLEDDFTPTGTAVSNLLASLGGTQVTDADPGEVAGMAITARDNTNGQWLYSTNSGVDYLDLGAVTPTAARLLAPDALLRFVPNLDFFGVATIAFRAWDQNLGTNTAIVTTAANGGTNVFSSAVATGQVTVLDVNEAPLLDGAATMTLSAISANDFASAGDTVAAIIATAGDPITDDDAGDPEGFAVIAVDTTFGLWQFSIDAGANWNLLGPVVDASATLLDETALIRFIPLPNFSGPATIGIRAWDQSSGANGLGGVDASVNGGSTAFSTNFVSVSITVTSTNNAPVLDNTGTLLLTPILQDNTNSPGDSVISLLASGGGDPITDIDPGALEGLAVTGVDDANGTWQYSINAGATWLPLGGVADTTAVLLDQDGLVRFVPDPGFFGAVEVVFRAWDQSSLLLSGATGINVSVNGGTTPFSSGIETARLDVIEIGVNVAPIFNPSGDLKLPDLFENNFTNTGATVGAILASGGGTPITDVDGDPIGIAVVAADFSNGVWQYSTNSGSSWNALNSVAQNLAVVLDTNALIRFIPNAGFLGAGGTITIHGWDGSDLRNSGDTGVDATAAGGSTPFSSASDTVRVEVLPMADLAIGKEALGTAIAGTLLTYKVTVTNHGPSDATNVVVNDTLPPEGTPTGLITTNLGTIFVGGSKSFLITIDLPPSLRGVLTNIALASSELTDVDPARASVTNLTPVTVAADLGISVITAPTPPGNSGPLTYTLRVTNSGPGNATGVVVTNVLPPEVTLVAATGGVAVGNTVVFSPGDVAIGSTTTFTIRVTVPDIIGDAITNSASVSTADSDPNLTNNVAVTTGLVINARATVDVDGDGRSDPATFLNGAWNVRGSQAGLQAFLFGFPGVIPVSGDFDGDGRADSGVYHPDSGTWYLFRTTAGFMTTAFGFPGTVPVPADYDGDGRTDIAVFDAPNGLWYLFRSTLGFTTTQFGFAGVTPVPADYDGDGRDDTAVYDANTGTWYLFRSTLGFTTTVFGFPGTLAAPADFDGDSRTDIAVYNPPTGEWFLFRSTLGFSTTAFGFAGTLPVPADYDGDGRADLGVYDPAESRWYLLKTSQGFETFVLGAPGSRPVVAPAR